MRGWGARKTRRSSGIAARAASKASEEASEEASTLLAVGMQKLTSSYDAASVVKDKKTRKGEHRRRTANSAEDPFVNGNWSDHVAANDRNEAKTVANRISGIIKYGGDDEFVLSPGASKRLSTLADTVEDDMANW